MKKTVNMPNTEPNSYEKPSEKEHLFEVVNTQDNLDGTVSAKLKVIGGEEDGRTMFNRVSYDENWSGFFTTRLFLKAVGEPYKGDGVDIQSDNWIGRRFFATVIHKSSTDGSKVYANIKDYNFEKTLGLTTEEEWDKDIK